MARKPTPGLPDVFAKPGGAPARGTSIEDFPTTATDPGGFAAAAADGPAEIAGITTNPIIPGSDGYGAPSAAPAATRPFAADTPAPPPSPGTPHPTGARPMAPRALPGGVPALVWAVLVISLTAPLWESPVLSGLGIRTSDQRIAAQNAAGLVRQDARIAALEQRLSSTTTQLEAVRADLALATQRAVAASGQARAEALLRLADALRGAEPFATELAVLRAETGDASGLQPMLTQLAPYASTGAPTPTQLQHDLLVLQDSMARAIRQAHPSSWMDLINWTGLNGPQPAAQVDPGLRAIRLGLTRLAAGDISGAVDQAGQIDNAFQPDIADWINEAKARLAADAALRQISALLTRPSKTQ